MTSDGLAAGQSLGSFSLIRRLAIGGMAEIWLALERKTEGRELPIALKALLAPYARDPAFRAMFADEVSIASRLTHENIVQVYGAFEIDGHLVQSMELIDGKDLRRILSSLARSGRAFPIPLALLVARDVARALDYAHTKRADDGRPLEIVHRDISPHNVMITRDGSVKLLDFGIARAAERLTRTRTGVIKGKIAYMAPEQAVAMQVSPKTDLFALGIVLWESLTMQRLFKAESDAIVLERVIKAEVPKLRAVNPEVPDEVEQLVSQLLAQRAHLRPASARVVENALTRILMRHCDERTCSRDALARWVAPLLDPDPRRLERSATPSLGLAEAIAALEAAPVPKAVIAEEPPGPPASPSRELEPIGEADRTHPDLDTPLDLHPHGAGDQTLAGAVLDPPLQPLAPPAAGEPALALNTLPGPGGADEDPTTDRVRLPTRSEIMRAVDAVPTMQVAIDRAGAGRTAPHLERTDPHETVHAPPRAEAKMVGSGSPAFADESPGAGHPIEIARASNAPAALLDTGADRLESTPDTTMHSIEQGDPPIAEPIVGPAGGAEARHPSPSGEHRALDPVRVEVEPAIAAPELAVPRGAPLPSVPPPVPSASDLWAEPPAPPAPHSPVARVVRPPPHNKSAPKPSPSTLALWGLSAGLLALALLLWLKTC